MQNLKRALLCVLAIVMLASMVVGCTAAPAPTPAPAAPAPAAPTAAPAAATPAPAAATPAPAANATPLPPNNTKPYNDPGVLPIVNAKTVIKVGVPQGQHVKDWNTVYQTTFMEEKTGLDFEFTLFPDAEYLQKIELMIAAGGSDLPDVIVRGLNQQQIMPWAEAKMIVPLTKYYNELFYWGNETIQQSKDLSKEYIMKYITSYDGEIYGAYSFNNTQNNQYSSSRINIYRPWLQELKLPIPSTTDDFLSTLKTFKATDLNKNGKNDEIPLSGYKDSVSNLRKFLMTPFVYTRNEYWNNDNGTISAAFIKDEWREGLKYAATLYKEGLIDPAHFTQDQAAMTAVCSADPQLYGAYTRISTSNMAADDMDRYNYDRIEQLTNSATGKTMTSIDPALPGISAVITKNCKTPEAAYMWLDYMTGADCSVITRYGVEGKEWEKIDSAKAEAQLIEFWKTYPGGNLLEQFYGAGAKPRVGTRFFSSSSWGTTQETWWGQVGPNVMTEETQNTFGVKFPESEREIAAYVNEFYARKQLEEAMELRDESLIVAGLIYNKAEQEIINTVYAEIKLYVEESWAQFVVGTLDINNDGAWNSYVSTLDKMGLKDCVAATQSCFTRMSK